MSLTKLLGKLRVDTLLAFIIVARLSCPALSNLPLMSMAFVFGYGMLFVVMFLITLRVNKREMIILACVALYMLYVVAQTIIAGKDIFGTEAFNSYIIFFLVCIYMWSKRQSLSVKRGLLGFILGGCTFNYLYSIYVLYLDPTASRVAATHILDKSPYDVLNAVGSFDTVYGAIAVLVILLYMRRTISGKRMKLWVTAVIVLDVVFIIMASYATALVLMILAFTLYVGKKNKFLTLIMIALMVMLVFFHEQFGGWIINVSKSISYSPVVSEKLGEFGYMIQTFETAGTYGGDDGRLARMLISLDAFSMYPIFGGYTVAGAKVGGHSELCDILGRFGIVGTALIVLMFFHLSRDIRASQDNSDNKKCVGTVYLLFIVTSVLNPALYTLQMLPIILMLPLMGSFSDKANDEETAEADNVSVAGKSE